MCYFIFWTCILLNMLGYSHVITGITYTIVSPGTIEVMNILPNGTGECIKSTWIWPQIDLQNHPDSQQLIHGDFGSLTWLHQQIWLNSCLICYWFPRGYFWSSNFSDRSLEWKYRVKKSFAYKEGFKWTLCNTVRRFIIDNKHNLEAFSNWDKKILAENLKFWGKCRNVPKTLCALLEMWTSWNSKTWLLPNLTTGNLSSH